MVFSGNIACFYFSFACKQKKRFQKKRLMRECGFSLNYRYRIFRSIAARALSLCSRSSREGFSFLLPEQKKRNKENSPSALFCLLRHFSPLNKKNSLRSNSFLFFTLRKAPSLHGKKVRPDLCAFFMQHRFARWVLVFSLFCFACFLLSRAERSEVKDLVYIHTTSEAMCPPGEGFSGLSGGA